jgi:hypothetical protein
VSPVSTTIFVDQLCRVLLMSCLQVQVPNSLLSFFSRTLFKLLNGVFFSKKFYMKVVLKKLIHFSKKMLILN